MKHMKLVFLVLFETFVKSSFIYMHMKKGTDVGCFLLQILIPGLPVIPIICVLSIDHNLYKGGDH